MNVANQVIRCTYGCTSFQKGRHAPRFRKVRKISEKEKWRNPFSVASNVKACGREIAGKIHISEIPNFISQFRKTNTFLDPTEALAAGMFGSIRRSLHKKWSFPLRISSVNVTKWARNAVCSHAISLKMTHPPRIRDLITEQPHRCFAGSYTS